MHNLNPLIAFIVLTHSQLLGSVFTPWEIRFSESILGPSNSKLLVPSLAAYMNPRTPIGVTLSSTQHFPRHDRNIPFSK